MQPSDISRRAKLIEIAKAAREHRGWYQKDAGRATGHCTRVVSDFETGAKDLLTTFDYTFRLCEAAGRSDLADEAMRIYSRRHMIGPLIPKQLDPHLGAVHQYAEQQHAESEAAFAKIALIDVARTPPAALIESAIEQADVAEAAWYELEARCNLAGISVRDAFRGRRQRPAAVA